MTEKDEIAIVGVGCRFPGADNLQEYWRVLRDGENHVVEVPADRWNVESFYSPDPMAPGKTYTRTAGFLKSINEWDHKLYGINDIEAELIDPQQRLVLDCVHMALEDAGVTRKDIKETRTGVYIGSMNDDYKGQVLDGGTVSNTYTVTGTQNSIISARVSYIYNLTGPAVTLDTACSSSLVAIDIASQAILSGQCDTAICGGVNVLMDPQLFVALSKARMLSPTGQCKTFTAEADGYARGEGCGIVLLKRLSKAKSDDNKIWGTIRTGTNQDGRMASPITAPSGLQQQKLISDIYSCYNVDKSKIQVIEAHGTGTAIGDPTECEALGSQFGRSGGAATDVLIGSVKTNIGHLEAAAGVAGLIKVLLMMKHETVVPSLWYNKGNENPKLRLSEKGFIVPTVNIQWKSNSGQKRLACVNSFGFGGTNAHAIVAEYIDTKQYKETKNNYCSVFPYIVSLSALDKKGLVENVRAVKDAFQSQVYDLATLSCTSTCKRDHWPQRIAVFGTTQDELLASCRDFLDVKSKDVLPVTKDKKIIFIFCGVGTTWNGMCSKLLRNEQFAKTLEEIDVYLKPLAGWKISTRLSGSTDIESDPLASHIAIFACQVGLAALWKELGVKPDAVIGQSVGEVAAAYVAGRFDLKTAVRVVFLRSKFLATVGEGTMTVVQNVASSVVEEHCKLTNNVCIAVYNSRTSCTVSGSPIGIQNLKDSLQKGKTASPKFTDLDVRCAYHSPFVEEASKKLAKELKDINVYNGNIPSYSTVTGQLETNGIFGSARYWEKNVRMPVLFSQAVKQSVESSKHNIFLEIGPSPVLRAHVHNIIENTEDFSVLPSMKRQNEVNSLAEAVCRLYVFGVDLNWKTLCPCQSEITDIPKYRFRKLSQLYQSQTAVLKNHGVNVSDAGHKFIKQLAQENGNVQVKVEIDETTTPFVFEHIVNGLIIVPGAMYADIGFEIARLALRKSSCDVSVSLEFMRPVKVDRSTKNTLRTSTINQDKEILFHVKHNQITVCKGWVRKIPEEVLKRRRVNMESLNLSVARNGCKHMLSEEMYTNLQSLGFVHGDSFRLLKRCVTNHTESVTLLEVPENVMTDVRVTTIHPCILDAMLQPTALTITPELLSIIKKENLKFLPVAIGQLCVLRKPEKKMYLYTKRINTTILDTVFKVHYNVVLLNVDGTVIADLQNYMTYSKRNGSKAPCELNYHLTWQPVNSEATSVSTKPRLLILTNEDSKEINTVLRDIDNAQVYQKKTGITGISYVDQALSEIPKDSSTRQVPYAIVFIVSKYVTGFKISHVDSLAIHSAVKDNCLLFSDLVRYMTDHSVKVPLFVVTQNTQPTFLMENVDINLVGQELWGFVRSLNMELIYGDITLIDLQPSLEKTKPVFLQFVSNACYNLKQTKREVVIRNKDIFGVQFTKMEKNEQTPLLKAEKKATSRRRLEKPHRILASRSKDVQTIFLSDVSEEDKVTTTNFTVKSVCLHPLFVFPRTISGVRQDQDIWDGSPNEKHALYGLEYTGFVSKSPGSRKVSCRFPETESYTFDFIDRWEMVAIFPSEISTEMTVPSECMVCLKELPFYQPGLLLSAVLGWRVVESIPQKASVAIFSKDNTSLIYHLLRKMVTDRKNASVVTADENAIASCNVVEGKNKIDILLCLETLDWSYPLIGKCKTIICLEDCLGETKSVQITRAGYQNIKSLSLKDLLDKKHISKCLSTVVSWLQKHFPRICAGISCREVSNTHNEVQWHIPCKTVNIINGINTLPPLRNALGSIFKHSGVYIVTGGLTGLGWELVKLIGEMGAGTIVSISRRHVSSEKLEEIRTEEKRTGCKIYCKQADVTNLQSVQMAISSINPQTKGSEIRGVFHGAGVLESALLLNLNETSLDKVLRPKVIGTLNMHIATSELDLDFFVVQSSINSIIGSPGQSSYGAANSFMDTFIQWRRARGMAGQAINWGALSVGMASRPEFVENFEKRGFNLLSVPEIKSCFKEALMSNSTGIIYTDINWDICARDYINPKQERSRLQMATLFEEATSTAITKESSGTENTSFDILALEKTDERSQRTALKQTVNQVASRVIGGSAEQISMTATFLELSFDSMSKVTFVNAIHEFLNYRIPHSFMQDNSHTLNDVENLLYEHIFLSKTV